MKIINAHLHFPRDISVADYVLGTSRNLEDRYRGFKIIEIILDNQEIFISPCEQECWRAFDNSAPLLIYLLLIY